MLSTFKGHNILPDCDQVITRFTGIYVKLLRLFGNEIR